MADVLIRALVPFFAGKSAAAHSSVETRFEYLERTLTSLLALGIEPQVYCARSDKKAALLEDAAIYLDIDPIWLPYAAVTHAQRNLPACDLVYVTEADQVLHVGDDGIYEIPDDTSYLAPWRLDLEGPNGEVEDEASPRYILDGTTYGISNGAHHLVGAEDPFSTVQIGAQQQAFSGAYLCTAEFFRAIKFRKRRILPVEHATGFDAKSHGDCFKTASVERFWIDHLSPQDKHAKEVNE